MLKVNENRLDEYDDVFDFVMSKAKAGRQKLTRESVPLNRALHKVLGEDVYSPINLPGWPISAMDGYACRVEASEDRFIEVAATIYAGDAPVSISWHHAVRIMTGAILPEGFNCVIPFEEAMVQHRDVEGQQQTHLLVSGHLQPGRHIKPVGSDVKRGQCLLKKGTRLRAQELALLASVGLSHIQVYRSPKVVILATGNELVSPGCPLTPGQIYDANSHLIRSLCSELPIEILAVAHLDDDVMLIEKSLAYWCERADVVLTLGGASVGDKDVIRSTLPKIGKTWFWKLNMKPAKPFAMTCTDRASVLALPGNPLAAFTAFQIFAAPFIRRWAGMLDWQKRPKKRRLASDIPVARNSNGRQLLWIQAVEDPDGLKPIISGSSSRLADLITADGYFRISSGQSGQAGDWVDYWALD